MSGCICGQAGSQLCNNCKHKSQCNKEILLEEKEDLNYYKELKKGEKDWKKFYKDSENLFKQFLRML